MAGRKVMLDITAGGYKIGADGDFNPFATLPERVPVITDSSADIRAQLTVSLEHHLQDFQGIAGHRTAFDAVWQYLKRKTAQKRVVKYQVYSGKACSWPCNPTPISNYKRSREDNAINKMSETGRLRPSKT